MAALNLADIVQNITRRGGADALVGERQPGAAVHPDFRQGPQTAGATGMLGRSQAVIRNIRVRWHT
jgi:hypothetical protein